MISLFLALAIKNVDIRPAEKIAEANAKRAAKRGEVKDAGDVEKAEAPTEA